MKSISLLLILLSITTATILEASRITTWNAGRPDPIPDIFLTEVNVLDYGAVNDSSADAGVAIQTAMDDLKSTGGVVNIPEGIYRIDTQLKFNGDGIVLRGAGADKTKLYSSFAGSAVLVVKYDRGEWQSLVNGFSKGTTTVTVTNGSLFTVGEFAEIQQENDSALMYTDPEWNQSWAANAVGQLFEVESIDGNEITFKTALHFNVRSDLNPQIRPQGLRRDCGIEHLYIEKLEPNSHTFEFKNAAYNWMRGVESNMTRRSHVNVNTGIGNEFRFNLFHHSWFYGEGGSGYGVEMNLHSSDNLIEDNIFYHLRHSMMVHVGAIGNVYGYNYSFDAVQGENGDEGPLNVGWIPVDISLHGHYGQYNLFEGNIAEGVGIGDHWGPMGPGNTFLKNTITGARGLFLDDHSHNQNIVGNWLSFYKTDGTAKTPIIHLNYIDGAFQSDESIADTNVPVSYYLSEKPEFWTDIQWPVEISSAVDSFSIPAAVRWQRGTPFENPHDETSLIPATSKRELSPIRISTSEGVIGISNLTAGSSLRLTDVRGRELIRQAVDSESLILRKSLPSGIFFLHYRSVQGSVVFKIVNR